MSKSELIPRLGILFFALLGLSNAILKEDKQESEKVEQVEEVKEKEVYQPTIYIYPSGATGTLPHDWETGQLGIPINN